MFTRDFTNTDQRFKTTVNHTWYRATKIGNKSHRPILRYRQLKMAKGVKNNSFIDFFTYINMFSITFKIFLTDLQTFLHKKKKKKKKKNLRFLQPVMSKTIGIGNLRSRFLKITPQEKTLTVLYTNCHISKSWEVWTWFCYENKAESVSLTMIPKTYFTQDFSYSLFCRSASHMCETISTTIPFEYNLAPSWSNSKWVLFINHTVKRMLYATATHVGDVKVN